MRLVVTLQEAGPPWNILMELRYLRLRRWIKKERRALPRNEHLSKSPGPCFGFRPVLVPVPLPVPPLGNEYDLRHTKAAYLLKSYHPHRSRSLLHGPPPFMSASFYRSPHDDHRRPTGISGGIQGASMCTCTCARTSTANCRLTGQIWQYPRSRSRLRRACPGSLTLPFHYRREGVPVHHEGPL